MIEFGPFRYDAESRFLYRGEEEIGLPPRVLAVLESLLQQPGKVVEKDVILQSAWDGAFVGEDSLTQAISQLRGALGDDPQRPRYIQTIPKRGYRLIAEVSAPLTSRGPIPDPSLPAREVADDGPPRSQVERRRVASAAAALLLVGAVAAGLLIDRFVLRPSPTSGAAAPRDLEMELEAGYRLWGGEEAENEDYGWQRPSRNALAISGDNVVYAATDGDVSLLFHRPLGRQNAVAIAGTDGAFGPFFAPDGARIGFFVPADSTLVEGQRRYELRSIPLEGGQPRWIANIQGRPFNATWEADETIVVSQGRGIFRVPAAGGELVAVLESADGWRRYRYPVFVHGHQVLIYTWVTGIDSPRFEIGIESLEDPARRTVLLADAADARLLPSGHLLFMRRGTLMAVGFDSESLEIVGTPVPVQGNVMQALFGSVTGHRSAAGQFAISERGDLVFATGGVVPEWPGSLAWVDRDGTPSPLSLPRANYWFPALSPDGRQIAYSVEREGEHQIWLFDVEREIPQQLTFIGTNTTPVWNPDGTRIAFASDGGEGGRRSLWVMNSDGSDPRQLLPYGTPSQFPASWSDEHGILYLHDRNIWAYDPAEAEPTLILGSGLAGDPALSPNGEWLAYSSTQEGPLEVFAMPYPPGNGSPTKVSVDGGSRPLWSRDGRELFYKAGEDANQVWAVGVQPAVEGGPPRFGTPRLLFEGRYEPSTQLPSYDVRGDGHFLMVPTPEVTPQPATRLRIVLNWSSVLQELLPLSR